MIPKPPKEDWQRVAEDDYGAFDPILRAWIRRAVHAESRLEDIMDRVKGLVPAHDDTHLWDPEVLANFVVLGKELEEAKARIAELEREWC